ncbi:Uncharacterised protein [Vibrio cholerae]|uniref:Uncharacterized protein n=1 Tax=Vibrio cholerae TaxID=666 RepID=A0A655TA87_VIBCL|nr:Uncharacterised protein [Vibrio cholerae]CSB90404.1 Uncharacterised protein [Vibrio cholerae]CSD36782.1 Uncharacterised protein [Vibrio cholerae]
MASNSNSVRVSGFFASHSPSSVSVSLSSCALNSTIGSNAGLRRWLKRTARRSKRSTRLPLVPDSAYCSGNEVNCSR